MSEKTQIIVNIEYCGVCDYLGHCHNLAEKLREISEDVEVICRRGRQGSFDVVVNGIPIYSKLKTMALPDYDAVTSAVKVAVDGGPIVPVTCSQPINCAIS